MASLLPIPAADLEVVGQLSRPRAGAADTLKSGFFSRRTAGRRLPVTLRMLSADAGDEAVKGLRHEASVLLQCNNSHILSLIGTQFASKPYLTVHEPCTEGYLDQFLALREVDLGLVHKFALDVCNGLIFLRTKRIVHQDVAARNVLVNVQSSCKLANFVPAPAESKPAPHGFYRSWTGEMVRRWAAPECQAGAKPAWTQDAWGYGFFLYELVTQAKIPYGADTWIGDEQYLQTLSDVHAGALLPQPEGCPNDIYDIMVDLWELEPPERPSFQRCKQRLASFEALAELDFILEQATQAAIAASGIDLTEADAQGVTRPNSPVDEMTQMLIEENAAMKRDLDSLRSTVREKARAESPEKEPSGAPSSPRPGRKFKPTSFDSTRQRTAAPRVSQEVVEQFSALFQPV